MNISSNLYKLLKFICVYIFFVNMVLAQDEVSNDNVPVVNKAFPIAVVDMQAIVGQSFAAVKVREFIENKKKEFTNELKKYCLSKLQNYKVPVKVTIDNNQQYNTRFKKLRKTYSK